MDIRHDEAKIRYNKVLDMLEYGVEKYKKLKDKQPFENLTVKEICKEIGVSQHSFYSYLNTHEAFAKRYYSIRENRRENFRGMAEKNLEDIMERKLIVDNKDLGELSLKILKATDKNYNQKQEIENTLKASLDMSLDEIMGKIEELKNI